MSGKLKKIIWLILMTEFVLIHIAVLSFLYLWRIKSALIVFVAGTLIMAVVQYLSYRIFEKNCVKNISKLEDEKVKEILGEAIRESENDINKIRIYENSETTTPFVMGIFRQSIILPEDVKTASYLKFILLHECFHIKRRDTLYKYFMLVANCFLWFNPLAYFVRYISYQDIEISCDESVVKGKTKEERLEYGDFLIQSVRKIKARNHAFSTYWNSSKSILKHRIDAVVNESRRWDWLAKAAIVILLLEVIVFGVVGARNIWANYEKANAPINEYEGVSAPPIYNGEVIQQMLLLEPVPQNTYNYDMLRKCDTKYPEKEFDEIKVQAQNPWQIKTNRPGVLEVVADAAIQRLYFYLENQTGFDNKVYEQSPYMISYNKVYSTLLAGDINNSVWAYVWKVYCTDLTTSESLNKGYSFVKEGEPNYVYFTTAVQIKMVEPYLFEVVGYEDLNQVITAYEEKYVTNVFDYIPKVAIASSKINEEKDLELQEAYANAVAEKKGMGDVRISFPENEREGYMLGVIDKVVMQVCCGLYKTENGGESWKKVEMDSIGTEHSLTYDFAFVSDQEGYVALHSFYDQSPSMIRTEDGGKTWEYVKFSEEIIDYCQAFTPVCVNGEYFVYVGKEGSRKERGEMACYESADGGKTWNYRGQVTFD